MLNSKLEGRTIQLIPMEAGHQEQLFHVLGKPEVWEFTWRTIPTKEEMGEIVRQALDNRSKGTKLPFTIVDRDSGKVIGTTRIGDIDLTNRNAEIGWTWLAPAFWRTGVNTECKFLLLRYCFEELKLIRVQFSVSGHNVRSQRAIERIGAIKEGVFRKHRVKPDGTIHDNVFYSILDTEWPAVKANLIHLLEKQYG